MRSGRRAGRRRRGHRGRAARRGDHPGRGGAGAERRDHRPVRPRPGTSRRTRRIRRAARRDAGPLAGVPFLLKDLGAALAGAPEAMGSRALRTHVATETAWIVDRYLSAGLVVFGKTNTPEWGNHCTTEPSLYGPTVNPWSPAITPGGSSGGSAAAVAAGVVPAASGGDGTGSIRVPASCCGLVGLKPRRGRTSFAPERRPRARGPGQRTRADPHGARQRRTARRRRRYRARRPLHGAAAAIAVPGVIAEALRRSAF